MSQVKKVFQEVYNLLVANQEAKVSDLLPKALELMSSKQTNNGPTSYKDANGNVLAVFCYYHKKWEVVAHHQYGAKSNTATGLNTMCKAGVNSWSAQQRKLKNNSSELLAKVASGEISALDLVSERDRTEEEIKTIVFPVGYTDLPAFDTLEELEDYFQSQEEKPKAKRTKKTTSEE
jgi:hypothetical protein